MTLSATGAKVARNTVLIQARVEIENNGHIRLAPQRWDLRLLSVVPARGLPIEAIAQHAINRFDDWPELIASAPAYANNELRFSALRHFRGGGDYQVEPGERDARIFDVLVSCDIRTARLTVAVRKPHEWMEAAERPGGWWWRDRMLIGLGELCAERIGTVQSFERSGAVRNSN